MESPFRTKWKVAMKKELQSLKKNEVADIVTFDTLPPKASPIGSRWVFKVKPDGTFKARLVVQGYGQRHGIDCGGTFAPCLPHQQPTDTPVHRCNQKDFKSSIWTSTAFLNAPVEEDTWVFQAPGFEEHHPVTAKQQVLKLRKSLYGLRGRVRATGTLRSCELMKVSGSG